MRPGSLDEQRTLTAVPLLCAHRPCSSLLSLTQVFETIFEHPMMPAVDPHSIEEAEDMLERCAVGWWEEGLLAGWLARDAAGWRSPPTALSARLLSTPSPPHLLPPSSYYIQQDYILRRLLAINERIDDTEVGCLLLLLPHSCWPAAPLAGRPSTLTFFLLSQAPQDLVAIRLDHRRNELVA